MRISLVERMFHSSFVPVRLSLSVGRILRALLLISLERCLPFSQRLLAETPASELPPLIKRTKAARGMDRRLRPWHLALKTSHGWVASTSFSPGCSAAWMYWCLVDGGKQCDSGMKSVNRDMPSKGRGHEQCLKVVYSSSGNSVSSFHWLWKHYVKCP